MEPPFAGNSFDPARCRLLSVEEKRELVREMSKRPAYAQDKLQNWSRRDISDILFADLGKDKKFTGLSKQRMMDYLFKVVGGKAPPDRAEKRETTPEQKISIQPCSKRQRKNENPSRLPFDVNGSVAADSNPVPAAARCCKNSACRAALNKADAFCQRCSCCICHKYDDNKDPSLWLFCSSESPSQGYACGSSCHIECALEDQRSGISKREMEKPADGFYYCVHCRKQNDLLGCWRKQLLVAKEARRLDVLCHRIYLSHSLLSSSAKYQALHEMVDTAKKKLEHEVGPITKAPTMGRGIVSRLSVGVEVQKLCAHAIETLNSKHSIRAEVQKPVISREKTACIPIPASFVTFEDIGKTSISVLLDFESQSELVKNSTGFTFWHHACCSTFNLAEPTGTIFVPSRRLTVPSLTPETEYVLKVVAFSGVQELGCCEVQVRTASVLDDKYSLQEGGVGSGRHDSPKNSSGLSNPSSEGVESNNNTAVYADLNKSPELEFECGAPGIPDAEKSAYEQTTDESKERKLEEATLAAEVAAVEELPGSSVSPMDEELVPASESELPKEFSGLTKLYGVADGPNSDNASNAVVVNELALVPNGCADTPSRIVNGKEIVQNNGPASKPEREPGSSSNKRSLEKFEVGHKNECHEHSFEYCIKVIRWLECEGYIERNFRVKFLTWFSLHATVHQRKIVGVFINTLIDEPVNLAGQLIDSFSDVIFSKRPRAAWSAAAGCTDLWH